MIKNYSFVRLPNESLFLFASEVSKKAKADTKLSVAASSSLTKLQTKLDKFDALLQKSRKNLHTDTIYETGNQGLVYYRAIKSTINCGLLESGETYQAALQLDHVLSAYNLTSRSRLTLRVGMFINIIQDLQDNATYVETLKLTDTVAKLKSYADDMYSNFYERADENKDIVVGATKVAKEELCATLSELVSVVNGLSVTSTDYDDFMKFYASESTYYRKIVLGIKSTATDDAKSTDDTEQTTDDSKQPADDTTPTVTKYTVTVAASPSDGGTVTGGGEVTAGSTVTVVATAATGYTFTKWSDGSTDASHTITVNADTTLTATFTAESVADDEGFHQ